MINSNIINKLFINHNESINYIIIIRKNELFALKFKILFIFI